MATINKNTSKSFYALALARIGLGFIFLWAFFDKLLGLGFATCRDAASGFVNEGCSQAWLHGGSPTTGFLGHATKGPLADFYQGLAGHAWVDWLFMAALLFIGVSLLFGILIRLATTAGILLLAMMWSAVLWPANNPLLDDHIIYILLLAAINMSNSQQKLGYGDYWKTLHIVKHNPYLE